MENETIELIAPYEEMNEDCRIELTNDEKVEKPVIDERATIKSYIKLE
ncbi:MAG: hypothetical protein WC679_13750 [Bacteroidales bacterium]|jgi:hypothetical protein